MDEKKVDQLHRKQDRQRMKNKRKTEANAAYGGVMDKYTHLHLDKLRMKGIYSELVGIISAGKEANVYFARGPEPNHPPLAIKVYKIDPQNTKWMKNYIIGDPRFQKIGNSTHKIIYTWCKKEYKNLTQLVRHQIPVPKPVAYRNNILVMEFIGSADGTPAKRLKDQNEFPSSEQSFLNILQYIQDMYVKAHLVHGDLSEYNILWDHDHQVIIDVSQAVSTFHMNAPFFLKRDVHNVLNFYSSYVSQDLLPDIDQFVRETITLALD